MQDETPAPTGPAQNRPRKQTSFFGDVMRLVTGTTVAQALGVLITPILAYIYTPDAFGVWGIFVSTVSILSVIACLRYELAVVLPEADEDGANLLAAALSFALLTGLLTLGVVAAGREWLANLLRAPELAPYLWLLPVNVFFGGVFLALNYWNTRSKMFVRLSIAQVSNSFVMLAVQLIAGLAGYNGGGGLILGSVAGATISALVLGYQIWRDDHALFLRAVRLPAMRLVISRYRKFPLFSTWAALMNSISWQLPTYLLTYYFSTEISGYYTFGNRLLRLPMSLIGNSISQVFFQRSAEAKAEGKLAGLVEGAFRRLVIFSLFPMLVLSLTGQPIFTAIFGVKYAESGLYVQILSLWTFFWFISSPLSNLFATLERQGFSLTINALILVTRFLSLIIGGALGDARLTIILFAISGALTYGYLSLVTLTASGVPVRAISKIILLNLAFFIPAGLILWGMQLVDLSPWWVVAAAVILTGGYYLYQMWKEPQLMAVFGKLRKRFS